MIKYLLNSLLLILIFFGCSNKNDVVEYNKPALYWYNKILKSINSFQLDKADDALASLEAEHKQSKLIPSALLIVAKVHMDEEEYELAEFYLNDYIQKYQQDKFIDYIRFLKLKAKFLAFKNQFREQNLINETIQEANRFIIDFPNSQFIYLVKSIKSRLLMAKALFDVEIASLYDRVNKPKAKEFYNKKAQKSWKDLQNIQKVNVPWYRAIFE
jgi:outer membrane protein assembly factor BamD